MQSSSMSTSGTRRSWLAAARGGSSLRGSRASHGCRSTSRALSRSHASRRSSERIRHLPRDDKPSGTRKYPRDIFANSDACSESLKGYLQRRKLMFSKLYHKKQEIEGHKGDTFCLNPSSRLDYECWLPVTICRDTKIETNINERNVVAKKWSDKNLSHFKKIRRIINSEVRMGLHKSLSFYKARHQLMTENRLSFGGADAHRNKNSGTMEPFRRQVKRRLRRNPEFRI